MTDNTELPMGSVGNTMNFKQMMMHRPSDSADEFFWRVAKFIDERATHTTNTNAAVSILRQAISTVCEGWTLPTNARKVLETALWSHATAPVAATQSVPQFRKWGCSDWYDGHPDHEDGGGPYESRTLYQAMPAQPEAKGEAVAWIVFAEHEGAMIPQYPATFSQEEADWHAAMYGQTKTEVRALGVLAAPVPAAPADKGELPPLPEALEISWPEMHCQALGCGVEDRGIVDRYEAAQYGFQDGVDKAAECVPDAIYDADQMHAYGQACILADRARQDSTPDEYAYNEAANLAKGIYSQHYREGAEELCVLPDIRGVISQISNMVAGMTRTRQAAIAQPSGAVPESGMRAALTAIDDQLVTILNGADGSVYNKLKAARDDLVRIWLPLAAAPQPPASAEAMCTDGGRCGAGGYCDECPARSAPEVQASTAAGASIGDDAEFWRLLMGVLCAYDNLDAPGLDTDSEYLASRAKIAAYITRWAYARSAASAKDAERYRFLRDPQIDVSQVIDKRTAWVEPDERVPGVGGYWSYEYRSGEELDAAIDAAAIATTKAAK